MGTREPSDARPSTLFVALPLFLSFSFRIAPQRLIFALCGCDHLELSTGPLIKTIGLRKVEDCDQRVDLEVKGGWGRPPKGQR